MSQRNKTLSSILGILTFLLLISAAGNGETVPFVEPEDGRTPLIEAFSKANETLDIYIFRLSDDSILKSIRDAVERGVTVRALLEPCPGRDPRCEPTAATRAVCHALLQAGVEVKWGNPVIKTHAKAALIDNHQALVMTVNLERETFSERRDYGVLTDDPGVIENLSRVFTQDWADDDSDCSQPPSARPGKLPLQEYSTLIISPDNGRAQMLGVIRSARSTLKVHMEKIDPESMDQDIVPALVDRIQNGVAVQVLLSPPEGEFRHNRAVARAISRAGGEARFQTNLKPHAKMIIVDDEKVYVGSQNLTGTSLDLRREIGWVTTDAETITYFQKTFDADWAVTRPDAGNP